MNTQPILNLHTWVSLPADIRNKIRVEFKIPRSGNVIVADNKIETDGTTHEDFKTLTTEKMQSFLNSKETDFHKLFDSVVLKMSGASDPVPVVAPPVEVVPETLNANKPKNVKKSKKEGAQE